MLVFNLGVMNVLIYIDVMQIFFLQKEWQFAHNKCFFGNINNYCGIGSIYTRDPITGETKDEFTGKKYFVGNFSRQSIENKLDVNYDFINEDSILATEFPDIYSQLKIISRILEKHYQDMFKVDFVIENINSL